MSRPALGRATRAGTEGYARTFGSTNAPGHYSELPNLHLKLSSIGIGTFPGAATDEVDEAYAQIVRAAALAGINVFDTAAHYRYGRSARALGEGLRRAFTAGVRREGIFVVAKGGFLAFDGAPPADAGHWFDANVAARGLGSRDDLVGRHCLSPRLIAWQIDALRETIGLETIDAFLLDQPEVHVPVIGKERTHAKIAAVFEVLEEALAGGRIACYGISSFAALRSETDSPVFQSLAALRGLAERAVRRVHGSAAVRDGFRMVELPFNQAMTEGFTRFSQATGQGNVASSVQAAHQLRIYVMASHALGKGRHAHEANDAVRAALAPLPNDAQRALQFCRSTPGIGTALVGVSTPAHLDDALAVARIPPMAKADYLRLYERAAG
jgi:aryl-alcohol dehydrogenase-like predicted oxidoreductase